MARAVRWIVSVAVVVCVLAGCGGGSGGLGSVTASTGATTTTSGLGGFFGGNTGTVVPNLATQLSCTDFAADPQIDNYANAEATCRFEAKTLILYGFASTTAQQSWFAAGPQTADNGGTVILGPDWAISLFDPSQADAVIAIVGGTLRHM